MIQLETKQVKLINEINQYAKKLFPKGYYISPEGVIYSDTSKLEAGIHFIKVDDVNKYLDLMCPKGRYTQMYPEPLYTKFKDDMKLITGICEDVFGLYPHIPGEDEPVYIGKTTSSKRVKERVAEIISELDKYIQDNPLEELDSDTIDDINNGAVINYSRGDCSVALCKRILPSLVKTSKVSVVIIPSPNDDNLFNVLLETINKGFKTYNIYLCIKIKV